MSKYSFTDVTETSPDMGSGKRENGGCYVKTATGFVLGFLAIAIAVGVGLIVHFVENRKIECVFPDGTVVSSQHGGSNAQSVQCPEASTLTPCPVCAERICPSCTSRCEPCPTPNPFTQPTTTCPPSQKCEPCPTQHPDAHAQTTAVCPTQKQCQPCATQHMQPSTTLAPSTMKPKPKFVRLPTDMIPLHYDLVLKPDIYGSDPKAFKFEGNVDILLQCQKSTNEIILHADDLDIKTIEVQQNGANLYANHSLAKDLQQLSVRLTRPAAAGTNYTLRVAFQGALFDDMRGFYYSSYQEGNRTMYLAVTQFEPTDARKAFPCFDEPALKATYKVTLLRKNYYSSLSNMVLSKTIIRNDSFYEDIYETSLKMSTYLVAFYVGQLGKNVKATKGGLLYGAWARPQYIEQTELALDVGRQTIVNYENFFNISFPLPKQDMIAIPDFAAGGMENWGLITYRETAMLFNPEVSSEANRQRVVIVVTHELAHQWFGDLVTMAWWDDLWLNEGFATFVEYLGTDTLYPDWQIWDQFVLLELHRAFELDALVTSHPIYAPVSDPAEINEIFDGISYSKGGSIIRMMRFILGQETFKKGLTRYLNDHRYQNAHKEDLWSALHQQSVADGKPVDVQGIMDTWTEQMNYPVVMVTRSGGNIRVQQTRFLQNKRANETGKYMSRYGYRWEIPFTYMSSRQPNFRENETAITWFHANETTRDIPLTGGALSDEDWLLGNVNQLGYYRVNYDEANWRALVRQLKTKHTVISNINRAQIINDAWSLSKAGELSTTIALSTLEYLDQEVHYVPWVAARKQLDYLNNMFRRTDMYGPFKSFMRSTLAEPFRHYGMDDSNATHVESLTRQLVADLACSYGLQECVSEASRLYEMWMGDPGHNPIDPDLRSAVYCTAIAAGGEREWQFALDMYMAAEVATEKVTLTFALACTRETWLLRRYLELSITPEVVRKQDAASVLVYIGGSDLGQMLAWDFVRDRWDYLFNTYGKGTFSFTNLISGLTQSFNKEAQLKQLHQFLEQHPDMGTGNRAFRQAIETTESNIRWMADNQKAVSDWLKNVGVTSASSVKDVFLPTHLVPDLYDIVLQPNMYEGEPDNFNFEGYVKIHMTAKEAGKNVTLHANKLNILERSIRFGSDDGGNTGPSFTGVHVADKARQFEVFYLDGALVPGHAYYIEMNFTGPLTGDLAGLYLSQYERGNETVYIATSQMEATDARKAFPCFDEPAMKAVFNVKLVRKPHMKSISNMPIISNYTLGNGMVVDVFNKSAKMSTYLLALIVCDFDYIEDKTKSGITYRAWARPEYITQAKVALDAGVRIITYYEEYFGAQFPLPKQDMIAIPDFAAGAMENWGLITYRETAMLYEPGVSSEANLQRVNVVIAHELAHQWFGDLVTMDWWDDLWLNEGFATFVEYMGTDLLHPEWKMFEQFVFDLYEVFEIDSLVTSHPIYVPVFTPEEINEIFDTISYSKGGSVLRMMRFFLGEDTFKKGIQNYIQGRKYQNAKHVDLWEALGNQSREDNKNLPAPVKEILDTWILQMNYPVVKVTKDPINNKIQITQTRFLKNRESKDPMTYTSPFDYKWHIPFTFTTKNSSKFNITDADVVWLTEEEKVLNTSYPTGDDWLLGNVQQYGVYRVNYERANWDALIKQLNADHKVFSAINRGQLINDAFALTTARQLDMSVALRTLDYLTAEEEYIPWRAAISELGYISSMLQDTELYGLLSKFILDKVQKQFDRLPMNNSIAGHLDSYVRSEVSSLACSYGNTKCIEESRRLFKEYMDNETRNPIDPGLKSTVYCTAVREGRETEWTFTYRMYKSANVEAEKSRLLTSLTCTQQPWILNKLLGMALDDREVRQQDAYKVFIDVGRNPVGRTLAWDFFRRRWNDIFEKYGSGSFSLNDVISGVTASFNTELHLQQLRDFGKSHANMGSGTRAFAQTIENTLTNIRWMREKNVVIGNWLKSQKIQS